MLYQYLMLPRKVIKSNKCMISDQIIIWLLKTIVESQIK